MRIPLASSTVLRLAILLAVLVVLFYSPLWLGGPRLPLHPDPLVVGYPLHLLAARTLRAGTLPAWNPYSYYGYPLLAESQAGVFYPGHLPLYFLPEAYFPATYVLLTLLHLWLLGLGFAVLVRQWNAGFWPAFYASGTLLLGAYVMGHQLHLNVLEALAWIPWALAVLTHPESLGRWAPFLVGLVLTLSVLAGHPPTVLHFAPLVVGYALWLSVFRLLCGVPFVRAFRPFWTLLQGFVVALLLSFPQWWPQLRYLPEGSRGPLTALQQGLPASEFRNLFLPHARTQEYVAEAGLFHGWLPWILLAFLLVAGTLPRLHATVFLLFSLFFFQLAQGLGNPVYDRWIQLPVFSLLRAPHRYVGPGLLAFLLATALLVPRRRWLPPLVVLHLLSLAVLHFRWYPLVSPTWLTTLPPALARAARYSRAQACRVAFLGEEHARFTRPEALQAAGYPSSFLAEGAAFLTPFFFAPSAFFLWTPRSASRLSQWLAESPEPWIVRATGTCRVLVPRNSTRAAPTRRRLQALGFTVLDSDAVYEVFGPPREGRLAYLARRVLFQPFLLRERRVPLAGRTIALQEPDWRRMQELLRSRYPATLVTDPRLAESYPGCASPGEVRAIRFTRNAWEIEGRAACATVLVVTDHCMAGWRASVNGAPASLTRADFFFKGIPLREGPFQVRLTYSSYGDGPCGPG